MAWGPYLREGGAVGHHELVGGGQAVGHIQEGQRSIGAQEACIGAGSQRGMEYLHRVIGRAPAGKGRRGNDAGVTQRTKVNAEFLVVVLAQQLLVHLCRKLLRNDQAPKGVEVSRKHAYNM